jgi:hypothetical protein
MLISPLLFLLMLLAVATTAYAFARRRLSRFNTAIERLRSQHQLHYAPVDRLGLAQLLATNNQLTLPGKSNPIETRRVSVTDVLYTRVGERRFFVARVNETGCPCSGCVVSGFEKCGKVIGVEDVEWSQTGEGELVAFERLAKRSAQLKPATEVEAKESVAA